jgi:hypothetical protein
MTCREVLANLELYAVGALDARESAEVDDHLRHCAACRTLGTELRQTADRLPLAVAAASRKRPPPNLKDRVLEAIATPAAASGRAAAPPAFGPLPRVFRAFRWRGRYSALLAAITLAILAIAWGVWQSVALAHEQVLRAEFANVVSQEQVVLDVVDSTATTKVRLAPAQAGSSAYGKMYVRRDLPYVVVMAAKLPPPGAGEVYSLWLTNKQSTIRVGNLTVNGQGFGVLVYQAGQNGPSYDAAKVVLQSADATDPSGTVAIAWTAAP